MKRCIAFILLSITSIFWNLTLQAQDDVCQLIDGELVFFLNTDWSEEERKAISEQYSLDSLLLAEVSQFESQGKYEQNGQIWNVVPLGDKKIKLYKLVDDIKGKIDWKKDMVFSPDNGAGSGPGYVDMAWISYGVNRLTKPVIVQYPGGKTKFFLPNHKDAKEVFISGSFNNWSTSGLPMQKTASGWEIELKLLPGKYLYKFIVDGNWMKAPGNKLAEGDGWGNENSVFYQYNYTFEYRDSGNEAKKVYMAGSFNNWQEKELKMSKSGGVWKLPLYLKEGTHAYKFIVDNEWINDPDNPIVRPDGDGNFNSFIGIGEPYTFKLNGYNEANEVRLAGNFNAWNPAELVMTKVDDGWELPYVLSEGNYEYKFIVDGVWILDPSNPITTGIEDFENSFISISPNHTFALKVEPDDQQVIVTGTFNGWSEQDYRMVKEDDYWVFNLYLRPGKHSYKFITDGRWIIDPINPQYEENEFNSGNSVLWIEPEAIDP
ncbi:MAG: hypothetical protein AAGC47_02765 [Bacteroidota bacterium]